LRKKHAGITSGSAKLEPDKSNAKISLEKSVFADTKAVCKGFAM
jgi:hypothetical protein